MNNNSIPYGINALFVYNETKGNLIKCLYALHTVSGQPYHEAYLTLDKIISTNEMPYWMVIPGS